MPFARRVVTNMSLRSGSLGVERKEVHHMAGKESSGNRGRSAISGRFVKQSTVKSHPKTTVNESTRKKK